MNAKLARLNKTKIRQCLPARTILVQTNLRGQKTMINKRLKIDNLDNLQELTTEEVVSIQGGWFSKHEPKNPHEKWPSKPDWNPKPGYPKTDWSTKAYHPWSPHPSKGSKLPWCAVVL